MHRQGRDTPMETAFLDVSGLSAADRAAWDELASHQPESGPFTDVAWVSSWIEAYRPGEALMLCGWEGGRLVGLAALQHVKERWAGRNVAVLQSLTNVGSPRFEFLSRAGGHAVEAGLWRELYAAGRWDVVRLDHVPVGSPTLTAALEVGREQGWTPVVEPTFESPWRSLGRPWDEGLSRKFRANLRNRERRLEALGRVTFEVVNGAGQQGCALERFYELEASGWKAEAGTAIVLQGTVKAFYDRLVDRAAEHTWIPILGVGDRPVAAQLVRVHGRTMFILKTGYHPDFAPYAPGQLVTARLIRYGIERGMEALDFLGDNMTWKADWAPRLRPHFRLLVFAPRASGRYAYWSRYGLREQAKKVPALRRLVRWWKGVGQRG